MKKYKCLIIISKFGSNEVDQMKCVTVMVRMTGEIRKWNQNPYRLSRERPFHSRHSTAH